MTQATPIIAIFFHRQNSEAARELQSRCGMTNTPDGKRCVATLTDGGMFSGPEDVDAGTVVLVIDAALSEQRRKSIEAAHRERIQHPFEIHAALRVGNILMLESEVPRDDQAPAVQAPSGTETAGETTTAGDSAATAGDSDPVVRRAGRRAAGGTPTRSSEG